MENENLIEKLKLENRHLEYITTQLERCINQNIWDQESIKSDSERLEYLMSQIRCLEIAQLFLVNGTDIPHFLCNEHLREQNISTVQIGSRIRDYEKRIRCIKTRMYRHTKQLELRIEARNKLLADLELFRSSYSTDC